MADDDNVVEQAKIIAAGRIGEAMRAVLAPIEAAMVTKVDLAEIEPQICGLIRLNPENTKPPAPIADSRLADYCTHWAVFPDWGRTVPRSPDLGSVGSGLFPAVMRSDHPLELVGISQPSRQLVERLDALKAIFLVDV